MNRHWICRVFSVSDDVLIIYYYLTNYPSKLSSLKQQIFIIAWFLWVKNIGTGSFSRVPLTQDVSQAAIKVLVTVAFISKVNWVQTPFWAYFRRLLADLSRSNSKLTHLVFDRFQVLAGCWPHLKFLATWTSPQSYSQQGRLLPPESQPWEKAEPRQNHSLLVT